MKLSDSQIKEFEDTYVNKITSRFKQKSKLHFKWYSVIDDKLTQYGTIKHLFDNNPDQIIFETYDHGKPCQVEIIFFDNKLNEINAIKLSNKWSIGKRISDTRSDKKYEIINPDGEVRIIELGANLYSKVWKSLINKMDSMEI
jgi:hypothetical protein